MYTAAMFALHLVRCISYPSQKSGLASTNRKHKYILAKKICLRVRIHKKLLEKKVALCINYTYCKKSSSNFQHEKYHVEKKSSSEKKLTFQFNYMQSYLVTI